jgi:hypothetical protein
MSELPRSALGANPSARARVTRVIAATHSRPQLAGRAGPTPPGQRRSATWERADAGPAPDPAPCERTPGAEA